MPDTRIWTDEEIAALRKRWDNGNGETLEDIGASLTPPLSRQRVSALLKRKASKPREKRATISVSLSPHLHKWLLRQALREGGRRMTRYAFFYPENGEQLPIGSFASVEEAKAYWKDKRSTWDEIEAKGDLAAFMSRQGAIVVIREAAQ